MRKRKVPVIMSIRRWIVNMVSSRRASDTVELNARVKTPYGEGVITGGTFQVQLDKPTKDSKATTIVRNGGNFTLPIGAVKVV